ncbi:Bug family tripartite tricarboxylate transporter substrate binding protein [Aquabacterium sp.]|uniref:Bug family tripartite tricarboxylate transporter substrate binding protein n=1 Tax=Aquabacterium sp. TaxID=1872578 RepID=UPI003783566E
MMFIRRTWLAALAAAGLLSTATAPARAGDDFPNKPLTLVVPFAPGGPTDAMARILAAALRGPLGQTVVVDNKPGAGGNLGAEVVARAPADGYTLLFGTSGPLAINQFLFAKSHYDPIRSFAPIIHVGHLPNVLVVNPSLPVQDVKGLIALAKSPQGRSLSFASSGNGASSHLAGVMFNLRAGTEILHVPYKGTGPALNDLLAGQVSMTFTDVLTAQPHIQAGKLRALAVTTAQRSKALPQVPTLAEQGMKDMDVSVFFGIVAPAGTPQAVVTKLNSAFAQVLADAEVRSKLSAQGLEPPADTTPAQLGAYMRKEAAKWQEVVKVSGAKVE